MGISSWWADRQARKWSRIAAAVGGTSVRSGSPSLIPMSYIGNLGTIDAPAMVSFQSADLPRLLVAAAWSYAAITATARQVAALKPIVQKRTAGPEEWVRDTKHPLNDLVRRPHGPPSTPPNWSWSQLIECAMIHLQTSQRGCIFRITELAGKPIALHTLIPPAVSVMEDLAGRPTEYLYWDTVYQPTDVVHVTLAHPSSYTLSVPPLEAAMRAVGIDQLAESRQHANLLNKISPGMVVAVAGMQGLDDEQRLAEEAHLKREFSLASQDGKPMVIGDAVKLLAAPATTQQLAYGETRRMSTMQMLAAFGMPGQLIGAKDGPTYASVREARLIWYDLSIFPYLGILFGALNNQMVARLYGDDVRLWYDLTGSPIALDLMMGKIAAAQALVTMGYPANIASAHVGLGLPRVVGLDQVNQAQVIAGHAGDTPGEKPAPAADDAPDPDADMEDEENA